MAVSLKAHMSLPSPLPSQPESGYRPWEDQSFIKWKKRDPHVTLHCHESVQGETALFSLCIAKARDDKQVKACEIEFVMPNPPIDVWPLLL